MEEFNENETLEALIDNGPEPKPPKSLQDNPYEISVNALAIYFHLRQFLPVFLILIFLALRILADGNFIWAAAVFFCTYVIFYKISTVIAERYAKSVVYAFKNGVVSAESVYCGFFSQKTVPIDKVSRITLRRTPLMHFCKVSALDLDVSGGSDNRIRLYGLAEAPRVRNALISARAAALKNKV